MDDQHKLIIGYRDLSQTEIDNMNAVKELGKLIQDLTEGMKHETSFDQRWVSIGVTQLQQGIMALVRAIAKPTSF